MGYYSVCLALLVLGVAVHADAPQKIVGGRKAFHAEFPFQVSLQIFGQHTCGGALISDIHVLTAAHCVQRYVGANGKPHQQFTVVTGVQNLNVGGEVHKIKHIKYHENYMPVKEESWKNDIALITLATPVQPNAVQRTIELGVDHVPGNVDGTISGFGRVSANGQISLDLKTASMKVLDNEKCRKAYYDSVKIHDSHICIFSRAGTGACSGDSGGPLVVDGKLVGVASWVTPCAVGFPDAYTRVSFFISWIRQTQQETS